MKATKYFLTLFICMMQLLAYAQNFVSNDVVLNWKKPITVNTPSGSIQHYLQFEHGILQLDDNISKPHYSAKFEVSGNWNYDVKIISTQIDLAEDVYPKKSFENNFIVKNYIAEERGHYYLLIDVLPLQYNANGQLEKLNQFKLQCDISTKNKFYSAQNYSTKKSVAHSVLATGTWYQFATNKDGMYKIDANLLQQMGLNTASINPKNIRIYSMGGGNIPELNAIPRPDDLAEIAIEVVGENDGVFNSSDYILFYGQQPDDIKYNSTTKLFSHQKNLYSNQTYYYITTDLGTGKRFSSQASVSSANTIVTGFDDYQYYDEDGINLAHTGRTWFDANNFDNTLVRNYNFVFDNLITTENLHTRMYVASQSVTNTAMQINFNNASIGNMSFPPFTPGYDQPIANTKFLETNVNSNLSSNTIQLTYSKNPNIAGIAWVDYISLQARRALIFTGSQMKFIDAKSVGVNNISTFTVNNGGAIKILDITNPLEPLVQQGSVNNNQFLFTIATDTLHSFIAYNSASFFTPTLIGSISNQDIHAQIINAPE
ncbi:MAG: hypothetical protein RIQ33_366, partial [Bacteroidota bacterium]